MNKHLPVIGININFAENMELPGSAGTCSVAFNYLRSVHEAGGMPVILPCIPDEKLLRAFMSGLDGIVFIGGADYPPSLYGQKPHPEVKLLNKRRVDTDLILARVAREMKLPALGICAGHQLINIERGGGLIQHIPRAEHHKRWPDKSKRYHWVKVGGGRILRRLFGDNRFLTNSAHHQAIDPDKLGHGLAITAYASDGTVEACEAPREKFVLGLQWHPEGMEQNPQQRDIFKALIAVASKKG